MTVLYHLTERRNVPSILATGLRSVETRTYDEERNSFAVEHRVYFLRSLDQAATEAQRLNRDWEDMVAIRTDYPEALIHHEKGYPETWVYILLEKSGKFKQADFSLVEVGE